MIKLVNWNSLSFLQELRVFSDRISIYGISVFETDADELIEIITEHDREVDDSEAGFCYSFLNVSIGLWRENDEEKHWDTLGIGVKDYYNYE